MCTIWPKALLCNGGSENHSLKVRRELKGHLTQVLMLQNLPHNGPCQVLIQLGLEYLKQWELPPSQSSQAAPSESPSLFLPETLPFYPKASPGTPQDEIQPFFLVTAF